MHCKNTYWNSRGCVKGAVVKFGRSFLNISVNWSVSANMNSKGTTQIPCSTVGQEKRKFGSKSSTESIWILVSLTSGLISGINCRTMRSSDGASRSGPLLQTNNISQDQNAGPAFDLQWTLKTLTKWKFTIRCFNVNRFEVQLCEQEQLR